VPYNPWLFFWYARTHTHLLSVMFLGEIAFSIFASIFNVRFWYGVCGSFWRLNIIRIPKGIFHLWSTDSNTWHVVHMNTHIHSGHTQWECRFYVRMRRVNLGYTTIHGWLSFNVIQLFKEVMWLFKRNQMTCFCFNLNILGNIS